MLGRGRFGSVFLAKRTRDSSLFAIKIIRDVEHANKMEMSILQSIHHPSL
jgi:serine/threonine protein kinase